MCRQISKFIFSTIGVLLLVIVMVVGAISFTLLNPKTYTDTLDEIAGYKLISDITESELNNLSTQVLEDDLTMEGIDLSEFITDETIKNIFAEIKAESLIKETIDGNLTYGLNWLTGSESELYLYFPKKSLITNVAEEDLINILLQDFYNSEYIKSLPQCKDADITTLIGADSSNILNLPCFDATAQTLIEEQIYNVLPQSEFSIIGEYLDKNYPTLNEKTEISSLLAGESLTSFTKTKADIERVVYISKVSFLVGFAVATLFIIIGAALSTNSKKLSFSKHYIVVGSILLSLYLIYTYMIKNVILGLIPTDAIDLATEIGATIDSTSVVDTIALSIEMLLDTIFANLLYACLILLIPSLAYYTLAKIVTTIKSKKVKKENTQQSPPMAISNS